MGLVLEEFSSYVYSTSGIQQLATQNLTAYQASLEWGLKKKKKTEYCAHVKLGVHKIYSKYQQSGLSVNLKCSSSCKDETI